MEKGKEFKEVLIYTAESATIARMILEQLEDIGIPARLGSEQASAGVFGISGGQRTIWVLEKFAKKAKEVLEVS